MKKIMMFLMLSVFFLVGGAAESFGPQKIVSRSIPRIILSPLSQIVSPAQTAVMTFTTSGLVSDGYYVFSLAFQRLGERIEALAQFDTNGNVNYLKPNFKGRISISCRNASGGMISINSVKQEDVGKYFIILTTALGVAYYSDGSKLDVALAQ